jgi:hypothetical protein
VTDEPDRPGTPPEPAGTEPFWASPEAEPARRTSARATRRHRARRRQVLVAAGALLGAAVVAAAVLVLTASSSTTKRVSRPTRGTTTTSSTTTTTSAPSAAPTTVVPKSSNPVVALAQQYDGSYTGTFTNTTYHTTGPASLSLRIDPTAGTLTATVDLSGDLFGGGAKQVRQISGTIALGSPTAAATTQTPSFGPVTGKLGPGLSIVLTAPNVPDPKVQSFELTGELRSDHKGFDATFTVGFRDGHTAQGTVTVLCAATGQRPSQVTTLCSA